jgi:hypothetical protein
MPESSDTLGWRTYRFSGEIEHLSLKVTGIDDFLKNEKPTKRLECCCYKPICYAVNNAIKRGSWRETFCMTMDQSPRSSEAVPLLYSPAQSR